MLRNIFIDFSYLYMAQNSLIQWNLANSFFFFSGSCKHGTFPCGKDDNFQCLPQHLVCDRIDECREEYLVLCGLVIYGHVDYIVAITNSTNINFTASTVASNPNDSYQCGKHHVDRTYIKWTISLEFCLFAFYYHSFDSIFIRTRPSMFLFWHEFLVRWSWSHANSRNSIWRK